MKKGFIFLISFLILLLPTLTLVSANPIVLRNPGVYIEIHQDGKEALEVASVSKAEILACYNHTSNYYREKPVIPELNLNFRDEDKNCFWKPVVFGETIECSMNGCNLPKRIPTSTFSEFKLALFIPTLNKTLISNEVMWIDSSSYNTYDANILNNGSLEIKLTTPKPRIGVFEVPSLKEKITFFCLLLLIALIPELVTGIIFLSITKTSKKVLLSIIIANLISLPVVWFAFPLLNIEPLILLLSSEIFAVVFEAYFIFLTNKNKISLNKSIILSFIMNLVSFLIGELDRQYLQYFLV